MKKCFLIIILFCGGCVKPDPPTADLIPKDSMIQILMDIHIAEAKVITRQMPADSAYVLYDAYKKQIYDRHKISSQRFNYSFDYYMRHLREMNGIYEVVIDSLGVREGTGKLE